MTAIETLLRGPAIEFDQVSLTLGRTLGDDREVLQGLDGGDSVVLDPPEKLADGARVRIAGDEASADANNE